MGTSLHIVRDRSPTDEWPHIFYGSKRGSLGGTVRTLTPARFFADLRPATAQIIYPLGAGLVQDVG